MNVIDLPDSSALILVAILPQPRDLEIARVLGWYRIPLRRAPKVVAVDYLAFYQPKSFGDQAGRIEWMAPVTGHELVERSALLNDEFDHPHARQEYFKIRLGALTRLTRPIQAAAWRRFAFFYTSGERLLAAETVDQLVMDGEERRMFWRTLRERSP